MGVMVSLTQSRAMSTSRFIRWPSGSKRTSCITTCNRDNVGLVQNEASKFVFNPFGCSINVIERGFSNLEISESYLKQGASLLISSILHSLSWRPVSFLFLPETTAVTGMWYYLPAQCGLSPRFHVYSTEGNQQVPTTDLLSQLLKKKHQAERIWLLFVIEACLKPFLTTFFCLVY